MSSATLNVPFGTDTIPEVNFTMEAGEDWQRTIVVEPVAGGTLTFTNVSMDIRNSAMVLTVHMALADPTNTISVTGTANNLLLHLESSVTTQFGTGFPGVLQSVGYFGVGRVYLYDCFVEISGAWQKLMGGFITVVPAITQTFSQNLTTVSTAGVFDTARYDEGTYT
jgi:hypothetical protein